MRVLIIEDDPDVSSALRAGLEESGYFVEVVRDGDRALRVAMTGKHSAIVLDLMLPMMDGISLCRALRAARVTTPILMLTAKDSLSDRVSGLESGADDFLGKPFQFEELLARVRALIRRDKIVKSAKIALADMVIDTSACTVTRSGQRICLTKREYTLLEALAARIGQVVTRETILTSVWVDEFSTSNTVDVHVRNLRKKIDDGFEPKLIHTVFGIGYTLQLESQAVSIHDSN